MCVRPTHSGLSWRGRRSWRRAWRLLALGRWSGAGFHPQVKNGGDGTAKLGGSSFGDKLRRAETWRADWIERAAPDFQCKDHSGRSSQAFGRSVKIWFGTCGAEVAPHLASQALVFASCTLRTRTCPNHTDEREASRGDCEPGHSLEGPFLGSRAALGRIPRPLGVGDSMAHAMGGSAAEFRRSGGENRHFPCGGLSFFSVPG